MPEAVFARPPFCLSVTIPANVNSGTLYNEQTGKNEYIDWTDAQILSAAEQHRDGLANLVQSEYGLPVDAAKKAAMIHAAWPIWSKFGLTNDARTRYAPHQLTTTSAGTQGGDFPTTPATPGATGTGTLLEGLSDLGMTPMIYMETQDRTTAQIIDQFDDYLDAWAAKARAFRSWVRQRNADRDLDDKGNKRSSLIILRLNQEMNQSWFPWGNGGSAGWTAQGFKDVWEYIHKRIRGQNFGDAKNVRMFYCPWGEGPFLTYLPPLRQVQYVGFDIYAGRNMSPIRPLEAEAHNGLVSCITHAPGKPIIIGETGVWNGGRRAEVEEWIRKGLNWASWNRRNNLRGLNLFDLNTGFIEHETSCGAGSCQDPFIPGDEWRLDSARRAWARMAYLPKMQGRYATPDPSATSATYDGPEPEVGAEVISSDDGGLDLAVAIYQEGTFTPTLTFETVGDLSVTYSTQVGLYTRIGNRVLIRITINTASFTHTTASGRLLVSGLPFTISGTAGYDWMACSVSRYTKSNYTQIQAFAVPATTYLRLGVTGTGQVGTDLAASDLPSGTTPDIFIGGHYAV